MARWRVRYRRGTKTKTMIFDSPKREDAALIAILSTPRGWSVVGLWRKSATRKAKPKAKTSSTRASGWLEYTLEGKRKR